MALKKIKIDIESLPVITDPRVAKENGSLIIPPRTFKLGDSSKAFESCAHIFEGIAETNGQEHFT
jgi:xanthine dehydrogenase large subunit